VEDAVNPRWQDALKVWHAYVPERVGTTGSIDIIHNESEISSPCEVFRHGDGILLRIYSRDGSVAWDLDALEFSTALSSAIVIAEENDSPP
jgi:hypothetical protein